MKKQNTNFKSVTRKFWNTSLLRNLMSTLSNIGIPSVLLNLLKIVFWLVEETNYMHESWQKANFNCCMLYWELYDIMHNLLTLSSKFWLNVLVSTVHVVQHNQ